uniref:Secreted protein n=1 Tax=Thraustotheca clavata TaxID=74557 RepID=A0A0A7CLD3_9STRA|nr:secreted protein [Thraustotheca clavata]
MMPWLVLLVLTSIGYGKEDSVWSPGRFSYPNFIPYDKPPALDMTKGLRMSEFGDDGQSRIHVVESLPVGDFNLKPISKGFNTTEALIAVMDSAKVQLDILAMYWNLNGTSDREVFSPEQMKAFGADYGVDVLNALQRAAARKVRIRVVGSKSDRFTTTEIQSITKDIRLWDSTYWYGGGIMHQKMVVADGKHAYIGSANMDWKSLSQVMELGVIIESSPAIVKDMQHLFNLWWKWSDPTMALSYRPLNHFSDRFQATLRLPPWSPEIPIALQEPNPFNNSDTSSIYNKDNNLLCLLNGKKAGSFLSASPIAATSWARTVDEDSLIYTLRSAKTMVDLSVMDFVPFATYPIDSHKKGSIYWPALTDTILSIIYARNIRVRLLISHWQHTDPIVLLSLKHLESQSKLCPQHGMGCLGSLEIRLFQVPFWNATDPIPSKYPPFTRVNHAKYIVSDSRVNIGTSNMEWGYFYNTAGASFNTDHPDTIATVQSIFQRNWDSPYAHNLHSS